MYKENRIDARHARTHKRQEKGKGFGAELTIQFKRTAGGNRLTSIFQRRGNGGGKWKVRKVGTYFDTELMPWDGFKG